MSSLIFPMILLGIMLLFGVVFMVVTKRQNQTAGGANKRTSTGTPNLSANKNGNVKKEDVFNFMEFEKIQDDMIVQKNGKYTMAIKCKGINYDLMSEIEQISVEEGFITFLNTLRYPIQLYVQAQNIDLKGAINTYKNNVNDIKNQYERITEEYARMVDTLDSTEDDIRKMEKERTQILNVYEYAADIIQYVERLSLNKNLLQRNFYILVSYHASEISSADKFSKEEVVNICYTELFTRAQSIISAISSCSVVGEVLKSNELADLLYTAYNRDDKGLLSVKEALDAGFYRLYSTSKDAFDKKTEILEEEIKNQAELKAATAIKMALESGEYESPLIEQLEFEERSSKVANDIIKTEDVPVEVKKEAQKIVVEDYKLKKSIIINEIRKEKDALLNEDKNKDKIEDIGKEAGTITDDVVEKNMKVIEEIENVKDEEKVEDVKKVSDIIDDDIFENISDDTVIEPNDKKTESNTASNETSDENDSIV